MTPRFKLPTLLILLAILPVGCIQPIYTDGPVPTRELTNSPSSEQEHAPPPEEPDAAP